MKEYIKPELEVVSLVSDEAVTSDVGIGGSMGLEDAPNDW